MDNVACTGAESALLLCRSNPIGLHNCDHTKDAGVSVQVAWWITVRYTQLRTLIACSQLISFLLVNDGTCKDGELQVHEGILPAMKEE